MLQWMRLVGLSFAASATSCAGPQIDFVASPGTTFPAALQASVPSCLGEHGGRNILLLSSGGADGAFGAGVLVGWSGTGRRPRFDVVTGVSTGALQATLAFLGSDQDRLLQQIYTRTRTRDVMKSNGPLAALFGPGVYRLTPLRERLRELIDEPLLDRVAEEHRAGRRLYVGTTDLTLGRVVTWDMGAIATNGSPDRRETYISVLLASSSVPGVIEPVVVRDGQGMSKLHGDGATKAPLLFEPMMLEPRCSGPATVWAIANGHVSPEGATVVSPRRTLAVARRGVSQLMRRFLYTVTIATAYRVQETGARFRLLSLPDDVPEAQNPFEFVPAEMAALYEEGVRQGIRSTAWNNGPTSPQVHAAQRPTRPLP